MKPVEGGVCAPRGFRAAAVSAQIKNLKSTKKDCALVISDTVCAAAGAFTTNQVKAAPVHWTHAVCIRGTARACFINSGNANACTGGQGAEDVQATAERLALGVNIPITEVAIMSTGVIGVPLPMDRITRGVDGCIAALSPHGGADAAEAIMTTDTVPKSIAYEIPLLGGQVRIGGMAKGAGMIAPNMATMLSLVTTDAAIDADVLDEIVRGAVRESFNCICVDNDMSTNDTVLVLANGCAGLPVLQPGSDALRIFSDVLRHLFRELAQALVRDGEGATKFIEIQVDGARCDDDARTVAASIAKSQLCKTAFFGSDPNWGRIACAAGYSGVHLDPARLSVWIGGLQVLEDGLPTAYHEEDAAARMRERDITVRVVVGGGHGRAAFWTSDLSYDYVRINADYRT